MVTGNNREISKENWKSSLSNNRDNSHFLFVVETDSEMTDFCVIKSYLLISFVIMRDLYSGDEHRKSLMHSSKHCTQY